MDAALFVRMLSDKNFTDLGKLKHKYSDADVSELVSLLKSNLYKELPLLDSSGNRIVYLENVSQVNLSAVKLLLTPRDGTLKFGISAMENEVFSSMSIENIDSSRDSIHRILNGYTPVDESENRIYGMKRGLEFISDPANIITERSIHTLYQLAIGDFLGDDDRLLPGNLYRHDSVYIVGQAVQHSGLPHRKLPDYMKAFVKFIIADGQMNDLIKAAAIHFYVAYLHPYFDGNGRMARLLHLWYLLQQGYSSALFLPFSSYVEKTRKGYYHAYMLAEKNAGISGVMDITPFLLYFVENVYNQLNDLLVESGTPASLQPYLKAGKITVKERALWDFVLSGYGIDEFSTKQLERDFGQAAYATIRSFVLKFEELGLLTAVQYGNRRKYRLVV